MNSDRICRTLVVIGGGAAGYFGAIQAASCAGKDKLRVVVLEAGRKSLSKVKISGGGRCNVMHDVRKVRFAKFKSNVSLLRTRGPIPETRGSNRKA